MLVLANAAAAAAVAAAAVQYVLEDDSGAVRGRGGPLESRPQ